MTFVPQGRKRIEEERVVDYWAPLPPHLKLLYEDISSYYTKLNISLKLPKRLQIFPTELFSEFSRYP